MALDNRKSSFSIIVTFTALLVLGCALLPLLPVKLSPSEKLPTVSVSFSMPGASSRTVESEATSLLESALSRILGVKNIKSVSRKDGGQIVLELDKNADIERVRFETAMIVRQIWSSLPDNVNYPQITVKQVDDNAQFPFMSFTINATATPNQIMKYAEKNIQPLLSRLPGVAKVDISGAMPMEWTVEYDTDKIEQLDITVDQIATAIRKCYDNKFIGLTQQSSDNDNLIRLAIYNATDSLGLDLKRIVVANKSGKIITLDKIAKVYFTEATPAGYFRINGLNSIYLNITSTRDANQINLSKQIQKLISDQNFPEGYTLTCSYDASESIKQELDKIYYRTGLTVLILLVFLAVITFSWRYVLLIVISLTINLAVAIIAYYIFKVELQLYSLAGITISLNLVIDNLIVMTAHIVRNKNTKVFTAILAATLTTIGALSVVFFLDEKTMLNLKDFVIVVIVNLTISLFVALFLVPALIEQLKIKSKNNSGNRFVNLKNALNAIYFKLITFLCNHKKVVFAVFVIAFGLPVFMLPQQLNGDGKLVALYNNTFGSRMYNENIRPWVDKSLGGTLRLFVDKVKEGNNLANSQQEPSIQIYASLPNGATLAQMNSIISKMESFLKTKEGIRQFQTSISDARHGSISVLFKPDYQHTTYPYNIKSEIINAALSLGGGSWSVFGLENQGFSNDVRETAGNFRIKLTGYNYDKLFSKVEALRDSLLNYTRINEVTINSEFSYWKDDYSEYYLEINPSLIANDSIAITDMFTVLNEKLGHKIAIGTLSTFNDNQTIRLSSSDHNWDVWSLMNMPINIKGKTKKLGEYATIEKRQLPPDVIKENQEYILCLQYEYLGSYSQGERVLNKVISNFKSTLPLGFNAEIVANRWYFSKDSSIYGLLLIVIVIIFFISSILFNSLKLPLAIIVVIPVSFIGVFLTFYMFNLRFDHGGFASFILLSGLTVNGAVYVLNEYVNLKQRMPSLSSAEVFTKAVSVKITAILLTVLSTILGFIPFVIRNAQEGFWFTLAAGTMGGLLLSLTAIFILLPALVLPRQQK